MLTRLAVPLCSLLIILHGSDLTDAQTRPARAVRVIVPSTAGGGADVLARLLADQISRSQDQTIVVENRPGASNTIGTEAVARAAPDGNTLLMTTPEFVINPHLRKLSYDPLTSFEPICYLARSPDLFVVNGASPYHRLDDLLQAARAAPGALTIGSAGPGSSPHLAIERLKQEAGVNVTYVPYQGSGPAINDLLGQHVTSVVASYPNVVGLIKSGQLRAIATAGLARFDELPDVRTVAEAGFNDFDFDIWFGLAAPVGTPDPIVSQLAHSFKTALSDPEVRSKLKAQGLVPVGDCGTSFAQFTRKQFEEYGRVIRDAKMKQE